MEYSPSYLMHHGIKGQRWGIRRYQNVDGSLTPAGHKRYLNSIDSKLKTNTVQLNNSIFKEKHYSDKATIAKAKGKTNRYERFSKKASHATKVSNDLYNQRKQLGKELIDELKTVEDSGYIWTSKPTNFTTGSYKDAKILTNNIIKKYGNMGIYYNLMGDSNASSGNKFNVYDSNKLSDSKKTYYKSTKQRLNTYRPQQVQVYYY